MSRSNIPSRMVSLLAATLALVAPGCDPAASDDSEAVTPRLTPPYDPTPKDAAPAPLECECDDLGEPVCGVDGGTYGSLLRARRDLRRHRHVHGSAAGVHAGL